MATELDRTIEARWASIEPNAGAIEHRPQSTIEPPRTGGSGARTAIDALRTLAPASAKRFEMQGTLGEGGMGIVRSALQVAVGREVAIKAVKPDAQDAGAATRLLREAWVTGMLEHPNVVPVYDVGVDADGAPQIVLKRIEGVEWASLIRDEAATRARAGDVHPKDWHLRVLISVCNAIHFAHSRGIVHRDLKPENVMIGEFGEVYVVDWGIAVSLDDDHGGRVPLAKDAKDLAGTPAYMAPEMLGGDPPRIGTRTDIYQLGAMLFEVFVGRPPHQGTDLRSILSSVILSPPKVPTAVPTELARVCERAMAAEPEGRYADAAEFRQAIEQYLDHRGSMRLAEIAQQQLDRMFEELEECELAGERTKRLMDLFGECRFGFRAALDAWPENETARGGLRLAVTRIAEFELANGDPQAARHWISELDPPPASLVSRIEAALRDAEAKSRTLEALRRDLDPRAGSRTRLLGAAILGVLWTASPLAAHLYLVELRHATVAGISLVFLMVSGLFALWARQTMMRTAINRRVVATIALVMIGSLCVSAAAWLGGLTPHMGLVVHFAVWLTCTGMLGVFMDKRFLVPALGYVAGFLGSATWPGNVLAFAAATNALLALTAIWAWLPMLKDTEVGMTEPA